MSLLVGSKQDIDIVGIEPEKVVLINGDAAICKSLFEMINTYQRELSLGEVINPSMNGYRFEHVTTLELTAAKCNALLRYINNHPLIFVAPNQMNITKTGILNFKKFIVTLNSDTLIERVDKRVHEMLVQRESESIAIFGISEQSYLALKRHINTLQLRESNFIQERSRQQNVYVYRAQPVEEQEDSCCVALIKSIFCYYCLFGGN